MAPRRDDFEIDVVLKGLLAAYVASVVGTTFLIPDPLSFVVAIFGLIYALFPGVLGLPIVYLATRGSTISVAKLAAIYLLCGGLMGLICYFLPFVNRSFVRPQYLTMYELKRDVPIIIGLFAVPGMVGGITFWALVRKNIRRYRGDGKTD